MKRFLRVTILLAASVVAAGWPSRAQASSPMGVYARVDTVAYEPTKAEAVRAVVHGVFALHSGAAGFNYTAPQAGYMYFQCPAGNEAECRLQWQDLENAIGQNYCAGFGQQDQSFGTVRAEGTVPTSPDTYVLGMGVEPGVYVGGTCPLLLAYRADGGSSGSSSGASTSGGSSSTSSGGSSSGGSTSGGSSGASSGGSSGTASGGSTSGAAPPAGAGSSSRGCAAAPSSGAALVRLN